MPHLAHRTRLPRPDDPDIVARIAYATEQGHAITTAGPTAGIGQTTAYEWYRQGEAELAEAERLGTPEEELGSHARFAKAVKDAESRFVERNLEVVNAATLAPGGKGWLPAMTLLERRRPQDFGRRDRQDVHIESRTLVVNVQAELGPDALRGLAQLYSELAQEEEQRLLPEGGQTHSTT